jgi:squalene-hopene/tetraprenyl-beta-curcumene cyclase
MREPGLLTLTRLRDATESAIQTLFASRRADGAWHLRPPSSPRATGAAVAALQCADPHDSADLIQSGLVWLRANQAADGGWADGSGGASTIADTAIAVSALALLNVSDDAARIDRALRWLEQHGGLDAVADPQLCPLSVPCIELLATAGLCEERAAAAIVADGRTSRRGSVLRVGPALPAALSRALLQRRRRGGLLDQSLARIAAPGMLDYLKQIGLGSDGDCAAQESPLQVALVCFGFARAGLWPALVERMVRRLWLTMRGDGSWPARRDEEFSATVLAATALQHCGHGEDPRVAASMRWIIGRQWHAGAPVTGYPAGGWAWSAGSGRPTVADTSRAVICLAGAGSSGSGPRLAAGVSWLLATQNPNGSWSCPGHEGGRLDGPCPVVTADAVTALRLAGTSTGGPAIGRAARWFARARRMDGSMPGRDSEGGTAGTAAAAETLAALGLGRSRTVRSCVRWLAEHQNPDGGWGGPEGSRADDTAAALAGLMTSPSQEAAVQRGARWLLRSQTPDGLWTSPGTGDISTTSRVLSVLIDLQVGLGVQA